MRESSTHQRILVEAQDLIQRYGFFGLSLQELADRIQIRKPSLYAHYDSKENLGVSVIEDYDTQFRKWNERMVNESPDFKLQEYFKVLERYLQAGKVCANSALSLDGPRLPESMRNAYRKYLDTQVQWLESLIREGQNRKLFLSERSSHELALLTLQQTVGAQLMARATGEMSWFHRGCEETLRLVRGTSFVAQAQSA